MATKRKDKSRVVLKTGEVQRKDGTYQFKGIFIVAGLHISNGLIQFGAEVFPSHTAVGSQNFKYIPVIFKALADGQSKSGNLALNQFAAFFNKIKGCIVG